MTTCKFSRRNVLLGAAALSASPYYALGQDREVEGGIGGTGIVGLLTDFGSLIVAGRKIETNQRTNFTDAFGPIAETSLVVGDSLTIEAAGPDDGLVARRVHVSHPLVGRATIVDGTTLSVNGVRVFLPPNVTLPPNGSRVSVSGLWRGDVVVASRLSQTRTAEDVVAGDVTRRVNGVFVGGVRINDIAVSRLAEGSFATIIGQFDTSAQLMRVQRVSSQRFVGAAGELRALAVEGYLEPTRSAPGFRISGLGHSFARNLNLAPFASSRTLFAGPYTGTFAANSAVILPEDDARRRTLLRSLVR